MFNFSAVKIIANSDMRKTFEQEKRFILIYFKNRGAVVNTDLRCGLRFLHMFVVAGSVYFLTFEGAGLFALRR